MSCATAWLAHGRRRRVLERYLDEVVARLDILAHDRKAAVWHAATPARPEARGQNASFVDAQIAAVAAVNGLTVVTRHVDRFATLDVKVATWHAPLAGT